MTDRMRDAAQAAIWTFGRTLLGAALGVGLVAAVVLGGPAKAVAQDAAATSPAVRAIPQTQGNGPVLWVIRDADSTIYLLGTVHVLRPATAWGSPRLEQAFDSADQVFFEIENPGDQAALLPLIRQHGVSPDRPLSHLISTGDLNLLQLSASTIGSSAAQMDMFRPWLAALTLSVSPLIEAGYDPNSGVEMVLRARALANGQPVKGLETIDQQVRIMAGFSEPAQLAFLHATLKAFDEAPTELDRMVGAWAAGDIAALNAIFAEGMEESGPEVNRSLLTDRNRQWAGQIRTLLEGEGTIFIAVGAAHLMGEGSVQDYLAERGVEVEEAGR
ncbi:MAG: TraB/GumN family protein [Pseudomonadota bacterium]